MKFTAIVATLNEEKYLRDCLKSLSFCDELIVVDLGSSDGSVIIAEEFGATVIHHEKRPIVEQIREKIAWQARNDWIVFLDPDEVLPSGINESFQALLREDPNIGIIRVPWQFYFKGRPLHCTVWGMNRVKTVVINRERVLLSSHVHRGIILKKGIASATIPRKDLESCIRHYWMDSYEQLFLKHMRYIAAEGQSRHYLGEIFSWPKMAQDVAKAIKGNLIDYRGLWGGFDGLFLSFFYAWYTMMSWLSLRKYENNFTKPRT